MNTAKNIFRKIELASLLSLIFLFSMGMVQAQPEQPEEVNLDTLPIQELREIKHNAFDVGEKLTYRLHYGFIDAAEATISVKSTNKKVRGREMLHVVGLGKTLKGFNWMFKVDDRYESYIDKKGVFPWLFVRRIEEGNYKKSQDYTFYQHKNAVDNQQGKQFKTPASVQDMISSFYYARTFDFSNIKKGDIFEIPTFVDDEIFYLKIKFKGKETIDLRKGEFKCLKFVPVVQEGRVFKSDDDLEVWITDDENKIPVLAKAKILVGSVKMQLTDYEGLSNPIAILED